MIVQHPPRAPTLREALADPALLEQEFAGLDLETYQTVLNAVRKKSGVIPQVVEPATMPRGGAGQGSAGVGMVGSSHPVTPPTSNEPSAPGAGTVGRSDGREGTGPPAPPSFPHFSPPGVEFRKWSLGDFGPALGGAREFSGKIYAQSAGGPTCDDRSTDLRLRAGTPDGSAYRSSHHPSRCQRG